MLRRSFVKGFLASLGGGTALVQLATMADANKLVAEHDVFMAQKSSKKEPASFMKRLDALHQMPEVFIRYKGEEIGVGYIRSFQIESPVDSIVTYHGDLTFVPTSPKRINALFSGYEG